MAELMGRDLEPRRARSRRGASRRGGRAGDVPELEQGGADEALPAELHRISHQGTPAVAVEDADAPQLTKNEVELVRFICEGSFDWGFLAEQTRA
jgi:hypothetical protein